MEIFDERPAILPSSALWKYVYLVFCCHFHVCAAETRASETGITCTYEVSWNANWVLSCENPARELSILTTRPPLDAPRLSATSGRTGSAH